MTTVFNLTRRQLFDIPLSSQIMCQPVSRNCHRQADVLFSANLSDF